MTDPSVGGRPLVEVAFDELPDQVAILDQRGVILSTNRAWDTFGVENALKVGTESVGQNYLDVCRAAGAERASEAAAGIQAVIDGDRSTAAVEYPCHTGDAERWFTMRATPFEYGDQRHVLVIHTEVTEQHLAEADLTERNEVLESVASVLSHDLRNPLSVALAHAEMVAAGEEPDVDHMEHIQASLERMNAIIDDALLLARKTELTELAAVDLRETATDAWRQVRTPAATLAVPETAAIEADASLLAQLLENLFRNAVENASGEVTVTVEPRADGFAVHDDGPGFPPEAIDQVFEPGFTTNSDAGGTGLGLPIVKRIATSHGWTVSLGAGPEGGALVQVDGVTWAE